MELKQNIILITGASSGIGYAAAERFAELGANLILAARRVEKIQALSESLIKKYNISTFILPLDVRDKNGVINAINNLPASFKSIDILVNNAGLALSSDLIQDGNLDNWETMIDTNIKGLLYLTHSILPGMIERKKGHIINIGSIAGRNIYATGNVYCATKHAVKAISESIRHDTLGKNIRVTEIAPGAVHTEFSEVRWNGDKKRSDDFYSKFTPLQAEDIADTIVFAATRPNHVNISEMVIYPLEQVGLNYASKN